MEASTSPLLYEAGFLFGPEMIERKSYPIAELKASEEPGVIEAIVSVFSNVDLGNEKVMPGFFSKSIEKKLPKGVWAHDWKQPIAKTLEAKELLPGDPQLPPDLMTLGGAYIKGQFNLDTQRGREAYSDIKFGIVDEFSIGYKVLKDGKDKETGARELIEGEWKEWSPVLVGMNEQTRLISIKVEDDSFSAAVLGETKTIRQCKPEDMEPGKPWCLYSSTGKLLGRHATRDECVAQEQAIEANKNDDPPAGMTFEDHSQSVLAAVSELAERAKSIAEIRKKEGRAISTSRRTRLSELLAGLTAVSADIEALLAETEPPPKEKEIDVDALRTQSLRARSVAMLALIARPTQ